MQFSLRHAPVLLVALLVPWPIACGRSGGAGGDLYVVEFHPQGTTGAVARDQPLRFRFSVSVDPRSVSTHGLHVRRGEDVVPGRIEIEGNEITFHPVVLPGQRNDYVPDNAPSVNGLGFDARSSHTVIMVGDSPSSIRSKGGKRLAETFRSTFVTGTRFLPEEDPDFPRLGSGSPVRFDPPPLVQGDPFADDPDDWPLLDPARVGFSVQFDKRIHPASIDSLETFTVRNISDITPPTPSFREPALMELRLAPEADRIEARSLVSLGDDPDSAEPYRFEVRLTDGITDLGGRPFFGGATFGFRTADRPGEPNAVLVTETFDDQENMYFVETSAHWGDGQLLGVEPSVRIHDFTPYETNFNLPHPLVEAGNIFTPNGCRFQLKFERPWVGAVPGESILAMSWSPRSDFVFASVYRDVTIKIGHFDRRFHGVHSLYPEFDKNFLQSPGNPLLAFHGDYTLDNAVDTAWVPWPDFVRDFDYDTAFPLVFEFDMPEGGDTYQLFRNRYIPWFVIYRHFADGGATQSVGLADDTRYWHRFVLVSKWSRGQSLPFRSIHGSPDYVAYGVRVDPERPTTDVRVGWAGSTRDGIPSTFHDDLDAIDGYQYLVFRIDLGADPVTGVPGRVTSIRIAYIDGG